MDAVPEKLISSPSPEVSSLAEPRPQQPVAGDVLFPAVCGERMWVETKDEIGKRRGRYKDPKYQHNYYLKNKERLIKKVSDWAKKHPEKKKEFKRKTHQKHKVEYNLVAKAWKKNNPEKVSKHSRDARFRNPEKMRAVVNRSYKKCYDKNFEKFILRAKNRRARVLGAEGNMSENIKEIRLVEQCGKCVYFEFCGSDFKDVSPTIDHKISIKNGGTNYDSNIQLCCRRCNCRKGAKNHDVFLAQLKAEKSAKELLSNPPQKNALK